MTSVWDLDLMILERTDAHNLKAVSRVKREWRSYTAKNVQKMRSFLALQVNVTYMTYSDPFKITARCRIERDDYWDYKDKKLTSVNKLIKYKTSLLSLTNYGAVFDAHIKNGIDALPSWWFKQITKVNIHLNDDYEANFLSRFEKLSYVTVTVYNRDLFALFIEKAPKVDHFDIRRFPITLCDYMLEALLTKSSIYPLEFPTFCKKCQFSLSKIIHFIENNNFTNQDQHLICIMSQVIGEEKDFTDWIQSYSTSFTCLAQDHYIQPPNKGLGAPVVQGLKWKFEFRSKKFKVLIGGFDNSDYSDDADD